MSKSVFFVHRSSDGERLGNHYDNAEEAGSDAPGNHYRVVEYAPIERHPGTEPPRDTGPVLISHGKSWRVAVYEGAGVWLCAWTHRELGVPDEWLELPPMRRTMKFTVTIKELT